MPFSAPTIATTGSMAYSQTCSGKPRTIFKMKVNTPPLAIVAKNPVTRGRSFHLPKPQRSIALTRMQQVIALKAVVTPANRSWVFGDLLAHLQEEHTAFTAAKENQTR